MRKCPKSGGLTFGCVHYSGSILHLAAVVSAIKKVHPYEEPVVDVVKLENAELN